MKTLSAIKSIALSKKIIFIAGLLFFLPIFRTGAETIAPQFLVSWQAQSYAPADFRGKILPTEKTGLSASFEILSNGKFLDLSKTNVVWLANGNIISQGLNQKKATLKTGSYIGSVADIEIRLPNFRGAALTYSFAIPFVSPQVIIAERGGTDDSSGKKLEFTALPYFFNVKSLSDLNFDWSINEAKPTGNVSDPQNLSLTIPQEIATGTRINIKIIVKNILNEIEAAAQNLGYIIK